MRRRHAVAPVLLCCLATRSCTARHGAVRELSSDPRGAAVMQTMTDRTWFLVSGGDGETMSALDFATGINENSVVSCCQRRQYYTITALCC
uniref:Secreted protein n=1 Tax=Oryza meridionalis TaxID=40149 RepID=A0A0E0EG62_9ORYZ